VEDWPPEHLALSPAHLLRLPLLVQQHRHSTALQPASERAGRKAAGVTRHALAGALVEAIMVRRLPPSRLGSLPAVSEEEEKKRGAEEALVCPSGGGGAMEWKARHVCDELLQLSVPASWAPTALSDWAQFLLVRMLLIRLKKKGCC